MNSFEPPLTDAGYLFTRSNEEPTDTPEVEAKLAPDYDFHGFSKEGEEDEVNEGKDYDEDDELMYGDLKGTNETMGEPIPANQTTASKPKLVNATGLVENSLSTAVGNSTNVMKTSESSGNLDPVSNDGHPNTTSNAQVLSSEQIPGIPSTSKDVDKNLGNVHADISDNSDLSVHGNFGQTLGDKDSASHRLSKSIKQNKQASDENSVPQSAADKFKNPEPPSSENPKASYGNNEDNTEQETPTNQNQGTNLSQDTTDNEQQAAQPESSQPVKEADSGNENSQEQNGKLNKQNTEDDNPAPAEGDNGEPETNKQSGLGNSKQNNNMTPENVEGMANSEHEQIQTEPLLKDSNSDTDTNNQNSPGVQNEKDESQSEKDESQNEKNESQNEKDESQMSQDTQEQNNVNVQETSANGNSDDSNGNLNPDADRENADNLPGNSLSESTSEEQHEPTELPDSQNTNDGNDPQASSNSLQPSAGSPIAVSGKPEFITAEQEEPQSENTQAWTGDSTDENDGISQEGDQGNVCFYHTRVLAIPHSVRWTDSPQLR